MSEVSKSSLIEVSSHIIAADFLSERYQLTQSLGEMLANFQHHILGLSPFAPFSHYSQEKCHESIHGNGTCSRLMARSNSCKSVSFANSESIIQQLQDIPDSIKDLDIHELSKWFTSHLTRLESERMNEVMFYEILGFFPSNYSEMTGTETHYRYVSTEINYTNTDVDGGVTE